MRTRARLSDLLAGWPGVKVRGRGDPEITLITADSRQVRPGALFVAIRGVREDGHRFLSDAMAKGAVAVAGDLPETLDRVDATAGVSVVTVPQARPWLGYVAARWHGDPSHRLRVIGVTGTNGKTTTTYLIRAILEAAGRRTGLLGTVGYMVGGEQRPASHTTPDAVSLQTLLAEMVDRGVTDVVMEVSSHALAQERTVGCAFDVGVFTNLTQDHLEFHGDMTAYGEAKRRLFESLGNAPKTISGIAVINRDDPSWHVMARASRVPVWTYGLTPTADVYPESIESTVGGTRFRAVTPRGRLDLTSPLIGSYNVSNLLAALSVGVSQELPVDAIRKGLETMTRVPGRFEKIDAGQTFTVVVDYAHTEDALRRVLTVARDMCRGRVITVFGCGGDRDPGKRGPMGQVAASLSDLVILTSDNPRSEDPLAIIAAIEAGIGNGVTARPLVRPSAFSNQPYLVLPDRHEAIERAIQVAEGGDLVVIAGKGHEDYQIIGSNRVPFDDRRVAAEAIGRRLALRTRTA